MAVTKVGRILRAGAGKMPSETMKILVENADRVQEITDEIDARAEVFRDAERKALAALDEVDRASDELDQRPRLTPCPGVVHQADTATLLPQYNISLTSHTMGEMNVITNLSLRWPCLP